MKKKIKAILFDLDNTLVDTHPVLEKYFFKITQNKITAKEEYELERGDIHEIKNWLKIHNLKIKPWSTIKHTIHFILTDVKHIKPIPGSIKLLEELNTKTNLAIVTNGPKIYANRVLRLHEMKKYFKTIQTVSTNKPKPNTDMIYSAAKKLNVSPKECVMIDDGKAGIIAGTTAGCTTIHFSKERNIKADYYAKNTNELKQILEKII